MAYAAGIGGDDDVEDPQLLLTPSRCGGDGDGNGGDDVAIGGTNERRRRCRGLRLLAPAREAAGEQVDLTVAVEIGICGRNQR